MSHWITLGKAPRHRAEALKATEDILELLDQIERAGLRANVSVKLTQIGLALDEELCGKTWSKSLLVPREYKNFVRIDMEDTPYTEKTIQLYRQMREKGYNQTGLVIQSYLFDRTRISRELLAEADTNSDWSRVHIKSHPNWLSLKRRMWMPILICLAQKLIDAAFARWFAPG